MERVRPKPPTKTERASTLTYDTILMSIYWSFLFLGKPTEFALGKLCFDQRATGFTKERNRYPGFTI